MQILFFSATEKFALTQDGTGPVQVWTEDGTGAPRTFIETKETARSQINTRVILHQDRHAVDPVFNSRCKSTQFSEYAEHWFGEYPDGWAIAYHRCKATGEIRIVFLETEFNPKGLTGTDRFRRFCQDYRP